MRAPAIREICTHKYITDNDIIMIGLRLRLKDGANTTAEDATAALAADPAWKTVLDSYVGPRRANLRKAVRDQYSVEVADALLPHRPKGRHPTVAGIWTGLSDKTREAINNSGVLPKPLSVMEATDWTADRVNRVTEVIEQRYMNATTLAMALTALRGGLAIQGVPAEISSASARPEVTRAHNAKIQESRDKRIAVGINIPEAYHTIRGLVDRIDAFIAGAEPPAAQTAADFLVALCARPGEAETLTIGDRGGVKGALKKRTTDAEMPLLSAVGRDRAERLIVRWNEFPQRARAAAIAGLAPLVAQWGLERRDLRAIGAFLSTRAAALDGTAVNAGQTREVHRAALRHEPAAAAAAQDHYLRVNDPTTKVCAMLAELDGKDRDRVIAEIMALTARK